MPKINKEKTNNQKSEKGNKNRKKIVLLDSHAILHRAYHAIPDFSSSKGEPTGALYGLSLMLLSILKDFKPDYIFGAFDLPKPTYRHEAYADYKAGRRETDSDLIDQIKKSRLIYKAFSIPIYEMEGYEADDVLGTLAQDLKEEFDVIIASGDMDTMQLIDKKKVQVFTLKKGIKEHVVYDEKAVIDRYGFSPKQIIDYKGLRGDPSDNIIGIKGVGEKTATILINEFKNIEGIYKNINKPEKFKQAGITDRIYELLKDNQEEAEFSKMLATISCDVPIKFELPKQEWKSTVDIEKIKELFRELEFKSLIGRLEQILGQANTTAENTEQDLQEKQTEKPKEKIDPDKFKKAKIMMWLLNSNKTNPDLEDIYSYIKTDSFEQAYPKLEKEIIEKGLEFVYKEIEEPLISVSEEMTKNGIKLDLKYLKKLSDEYHKELSQFEKDIWKISGEEFNINSTKQLAEVLFEKMELRYKGMRKTSTGKFSTKEEILHKLAEEGNEIAEKILEYRELQKLLSTYIDSLPKLIDEDGRLHSTFDQAGTTTGRMSSNNPNLQNIPVGSIRGQKIRHAFVADKNKVLASFDYSQVELRIAAILAKEEKLIKIFKENLDVHTMVAADVFDVKKEDVTKDMRRQAKVINFGMLYGMGVSALAKNLKTDRKQAQEFYNKYFLVYKNLADYLDKVKKEASENGYTETLFGRRRYFEGFNSKLPFIRAQAERMAINAPIQGTQADLIKMSMSKIDKYLEKNKLKDKVKLILQIHDEVIYEADEIVIDKISEDIKNIMINSLPKNLSEDVPILVDFEKGKDWGSLK